MPDDIQSWADLQAEGFDLHSETDRQDTLVRLLDGVHQFPETRHVKFALSIVANKQLDWGLRAVTMQALSKLDAPVFVGTPLCTVLHSVIGDVDDDMTVRQWAANAVGPCLNEPDMAELVAENLLHDWDIQWNLFDAIRLAGPLKNHMRLH